MSIARVTALAAAAAYPAPARVTFRTAPDINRLARDPAGRPRVP